MKKTTFNLMTFYDIEVVLAKPGEHFKLGSSDIEMPNLIGAAIKHSKADEQTYFALVFNSEFGDIRMEVIAHECFHIFFEILSYMGEKNITPELLTNELYAVTFENLVHKTIGAIYKLTGGSR